MSSFLDWRFPKWFEKFENKKGVSRKGEKAVSPKKSGERSKGNNRRFRPFIVF